MKRPARTKRTTVKDAIPQRIQFQVLNGVDRIPVTQHVVPLKQLVQHDPIKDSSEPETK